MSDKEARLFEVQHPERPAVQVQAVDRLRAVAAAAREWGDRWTEIARDCEVTDLGRAGAEAEKQEDDMIHEKGLCKVLSAAYKGGGYSVIPVRRQVETVARSWRRNEIILNGATWAVRCLTEDLPKEAAVQIVKDVGYMPMEPVSVQKNQPNQTMLEDVADIRESQLEELRDGSSVMVKIPVIFRDRWQLYQTTTGAVYALTRSC